MTQHLPTQRRASGTVLAACTAALLAACSGGGDGSAAAPGLARTATIIGRAVDGALRGASACYDLDDDLACGAAEPRSAATAADGSFRIEVPAAEAGRHAVVVEVPAEAVDADTNAAVGRAFVLRAPASGSAGSQAVFVSPLTTLVQAEISDGGATRAEAEQRVQARAGLLISPLADFGGTDSAAARHAARVARLVQLTQFAQQDALAGDSGGTPSTLAPSAAELERELHGVLLAALGAIGDAAAEPALAAASGAALQTALQHSASALAALAGPTADALRGALTARRLAEPVPANPPLPGANLRALRYTSTDNWYLRATLTSSEDNLADAGGYQHYYDLHLQSDPNAVDGNGIAYAWATGNTRARAGDLHWNGSQWVSCGLNARFLTRLRDAQGRSDYDYCDHRDAGTGIRRFVDIAGQRIADVVQQKIRNFPGGSSGVNFRDWGPSNLALYGSNTFPAGSYLIYQTNTVTDTAIGYDVQDGNTVLAFNAAVAAGGDARSSPGLACNDPLQNAAAAQAPVTTLETLIARNSATPCIYNPGGTAPNLSGASNQWWGNSTVNLGDLGGLNTLPDNTGNYYNTTASLRVGFAASGNGATFWRCYKRSSDGSPRNCSLIGLGSWKIQTLGDARVLSFSLMPALAQRLSYARVFVERGGKVYYGFKNPVGSVSTEARLNLAAGNAVLRALGLPRLQPVTQPGTAAGARAAALATLKGAWGGFDTSGGVEQASVFRFGDDGRYFYADAQPFQALTGERAGTELGWVDYDPAKRRLTALVEVDSTLSSGLSHPSLADEAAPITITATTISGGSDNFVMTRLPSSPNGLLGLWALGSATDLSVIHLAFFSNGRVMLIDHHGAPDDPGCAASCPPGVEYAQFTHDAQAGTLRVFGLLYDTNGCAGLFASCTGGSNNTELVFPVTIAADGKTLVATFEDVGRVTLYRIPTQ